MDQDQERGREVVVGRLGGDVVPVELFADRSRSWNQLREIAVVLGEGAQRNASRRSVRRGPAGAGGEFMVAWAYPACFNRNLMPGCAVAQPFSW